MSDIENVTDRVFTIAGTQAALDLGNVLCFNIVVLGGLAKILGSEAEVWRTVIKDRVPEKVVDLNLTAYEKGRELVA
jgi:indolepyruvate ferredoxin oxidoreductase beta subunit